MTAALLKDLAETHAAMHAMAAMLNDDEYRTQYHDDLSPFGWHVGHCVFIESYWLREVILADDSLTADLAWLYLPENILKPKRGPALPPIAEHLQWCKQVANENQQILNQPSSTFNQHPLTKRDYILHFLIQHHSQHLETMAMVLAQRQLQLKPDLSIRHPLSASHDFKYNFLEFPGGKFTIGSPEHPQAFDNELPASEVEIKAFAIADVPVSNSDWLTFIRDEGYQNKVWWDDKGWQWCQTTKIVRPETWHSDDDGNFYEITTTGASELDPSAAVSGINYFEANAFVKWLRENSNQYSNVRLPHEYEWEVADQSSALSRTGEVWEWCENNFHPYLGFNAFPYDNYSKPWFDNNHFSLRGGSKHTQASIRRSSFRNFTIRINATYRRPTFSYVS